MKIKRMALGLLLAAAAITPVFAGGQQDGAGNGMETITVLTNRTDLVDNLFQDYAVRFNEAYPNYQVEFEAMTDYSGEIKIRMNTTEYGDVLLVPKDNFSTSDLPDFFEPLGTIEEMDAMYEFASDKEYGGLVYGISTVGTAQGVIYNKEVFAEAGVTSIPSSPEEFLQAMQMIKDNTNAIPYYTNYADGWPLGGQWENQAGNILGEPDWRNHLLAYDDSPWDEGKPHYVISKMLWDLVTMGLIEDDPTTTDWEGCKGMIARGEIGAMILGSWSIIQMQDTAESLGIDPGVIGYMPFPYTAADGNVYTMVGSDYHMGINVYSDHKEAARAWIDWFVNESGFAGDQGGIPTRKGAAYPPALQAFEELGAVFFQNAASHEGEAGLVDDIDSESEIGLWAEDYRQRMVEAAMGNRSESFEDIMAELNEDWSNARSALGVE